MSEYQPNLTGVSRANHRKLGKEFENDLESTHSEYEVRRKAKIDRHPSEWEYIGETEYLSLLANPKTKRLVSVTGDGYWMKRKATNVDFSGVAMLKILKFGVHIKFDAKMTAGDSIPLSNFTRHQVINLCSSSRCGAIAGFMVNFYELNRVFFLSAEAVQKKLDKNFGKLRVPDGDGSIKISEMETIAKEIPYSRRFVDWYKVLIPN